MLLAAGPRLADDVPLLFELVLLPFELDISEGHLVSVLVELDISEGRRDNCFRGRHKLPCHHHHHRYRRPPLHC